MDWVKKLINRVLLLRRTYSWYLDLVNERRKISSIELKKSLSEGFKLILLPHVDDEWVGCSQVITTSTNVAICDMDMPGGDTPLIHMKRKQELAGVASCLNMPMFKVGEDKVLDLKQVIEQTGCSEIFVPFFYDWHSDHLEVVDILAKALELIDNDVKVVMYQVSIPLPNSYVNFVIPMTKDNSQIKWNLFREFYPTQLHLPVTRFAIQERINGAYSNSYAAEVFSIMTKNEWLLANKRKVLSNEERMMLYNCLNCIHSVRKYVKELS